MPLLVALPDKFRGTATAAQVAQAMAEGAADLGWQCDATPISDGGEGLLECLGGANRVTTVTGPLGTPVDAGWRLDGRSAVIEMATASGLALVTGRNDPVAATTRGTGELILAALDAGASEIVVGVGGSATTDGGAGAMGVLIGRSPLHSLVVAADVSTTFVDAAALFAPQKGADAPTVELLTTRLRELAADYRSRFGADIADLPGSGAAGGLAGGLAALGATVRPGFDVVAARLGLAARIASADLVLSGEGRLDRTSLAGKAPVRVVQECSRARIPVALIVGAVDGDAAARVGCPVVSLSELVGPDEARAAAPAAVRTATREVLRTVPRRLSDGDAAG